jgi:hypothetical protein
MSKKRTGTFIVHGDKRFDYQAAYEAVEKIEVGFRQLKAVFRDKAKDAKLMAAKRAKYAKQNEESRLHDKKLDKIFKKMRNS